MVQKIAIIGSGMAGLAASWFLGERHTVTLFERQARLGIGAHSVQAPGGVVDVPLRVIYPGYYPELFALLAQTGVQAEALDASIGMSDLEGESDFRYINLHALRKPLPWVTPATWLRGASGVHHDGRRQCRDLRRRGVCHAGRPGGGVMSPDHDRPTVSADLRLRTA